MTEIKDALMNPSISIEIDRKPTSFSKVWVHLKDKHRLKPVPFTVTIPESQLREIFDPYSTKLETESWSEFITNQIASLGTFILEAYIKAMARIAEDEERPYEWVITKLDNITERREGIELNGEAEPFDPARF